MNSRKLFWFASLVAVLVTGYLVFRQRGKDKEGVAAFNANFENRMSLAWTNWQKVDCDRIESIQLSDITRIPVEDRSATITQEQDRLLREQLFLLLSCYNQTNHELFLKLWSNVNYEIDPGALSYLKMWAPSVSKYDSNGLAKAWEAMNRTNRMTHVSLKASNIRVGLTTNALSDLYKSESESLAHYAEAPVPQAAIPTMRSIFVVHPSPEDDMRAGRNTLYASAMMLVKFKDQTTNAAGDNATLPLGFGLYWSQTYSRWIPHAKVFVMKSKYDTLF